MIVQSKSGTGKTCVFAVALLESVNFEQAAVQVYRRRRERIEKGAVGRYYCTVLQLMMSVFASVVECSLEMYANHVRE